MHMASTWRAIRRGDPHAEHRRGHLVLSHSMILAPDGFTKHPGPGKRILQMQFLTPLHQDQSLRRLLSQQTRPRPAPAGAASKRRSV
jgi:hypothetical protein